MASFGSFTFDAVEEKFGLSEVKQLPLLTDWLSAGYAQDDLNDTKFPILGAYVTGRFWFFIVLEDKQYAKSIAYDATTEDIFQIFAILQKSKEIIERYA